MSIHGLAAFFSLLVLCASCGGGAAGATAFEGKPTFAFVTNQEHAFWEMARAGVLQAGQDLEVNVLFQMPDGTMAGQKQTLENMLQRGVQGIAVSVQDPDNQTGFLDEVAAKVPLITHDADAPKSKRRCFIGVDNYKAGKLLGALIRERMPDGGKVAIFVGNLSQDNARQRRQGVLDGMLARTQRTVVFDPKDEVLREAGFEVVGTFTDDNDNATAKSRVEDVLSRHGDLDGLIGLFQHNAPQALAALADQRKLGAIKVFSFDEHENTLAAIEAGTCEGTVVQDPYHYGYRAIEMLRGIDAGDAAAVPASRMLEIPAVLVSRDGLDAFRKDLAAKAKILEGR